MKTECLRPPSPGSGRWSLASALPDSLLYMGMSLEGLQPLQEVQQLCDGKGRAGPLYGLPQTQKEQNCPQMPHVPKPWREKLPRSAAHQDPDPAMGMTMAMPRRRWPWVGEVMPEGHREAC